MSNDNTAKPTADAYLICDDPANPNEAFVTCPAGYAVFHGSRFGREERARWFAEAGNVFNETGLTPRQLAEQRDELLKALKKLSQDEYRDDDDPVLQQTRDKVRAIIAKVEAKP